MAQNFIGNPKKICSDLEKLQRERDLVAIEENGGIGYNKVWKAVHASIKRYGEKYRYDLPHKSMPRS